MGDLPAPLVDTVLDWIACDECGGRELVPTCSCPPPYDDCTHHPDLCPRPHVVVTFEGRRIHADPDRVTKRIEVNGDRDHRCGGIECEFVYRPVVPLDLGEAGDG